MTRALLAAALLAATTATFAAPAQADERLLQRPYNPAHVFRVEGRANVQATIQFGEDETIENVAIGDSQKWQVTPNKRANLLFVKPLTDRASTNMTVVTSKRTYLFDLLASPAHRNPLYVLSFTYPKDEVLTPRASGPLIDVPTSDELVATTEPQQIVDPAELNFAWTPKGEARLLPQRVYDDGDATYLSWGADKVLPAILIKDGAGAEGPVNYAVRGDVIVVEGVPREIVLRAGKDSALLTNTGPVRTPRAAKTAPQTAPQTAQAATAAKTEAK
ncbi:MAG: hypothetical protein RLZZ08_234 [Pseudomonadota bacterium]|jgi:type IV secretion system protein VirB9